jgi:hypothetical protein
MLVTFLWMALAASGGVLSGILWDRTTKPAPADQVLPNQADQSAVSFFSSIKIIPTLKLIAIITVGGVAIHLLLKVFKIRLFGKVVK